MEFLLLIENILYKLLLIFDHQLFHRFLLINQEQEVLLQSKREIFKYQFLHLEKKNKYILQQNELNFQLHFL